MSDVILLQLPVPETVAHRLTGNIPLGAASLVLFARRQGVTRDLALVPEAVANRYGDAALLDWLEARAPRVLGLTCTVWNVQRSLALARALKQRLPGVQVWVGGPEVASGSILFDQPRAFDVAVQGEGEEAFVALLNGARPGELPGVFGPQDAPSRHPAQSLRSLDTIHDPFLAGLVRPEADGVMLAEFWRGCVHGCLFCRYNQGRRGPAAGRALPLVGETLRWGLDHGVRELYLLDPSLEQRPDLRELLALMARTSGGGLPVFAELRADAVDGDLAKALWTAGVRRVETGLQTLTPEALRLASRPTDPQAFLRGMRAMLDLGIEVKVDLMLGLPGDSPEAYHRTLGFLEDHGLGANLQVFVTQVLPGTGLRNAARRLGLAFDPQPPYLLHSAPGWPEGSLAALQEELANRSGTVMWDLEPPVLHRPRWASGPQQREACPDSDAVLQYSFDLDELRGREALNAEDFRRAAISATLWLRCSAWGPALSLVPAAVERCLSANPFGALTVVLQHPPHWPLDLHDRVLELLTAAKPCLYLDRMLGHPSPHRRLLTALQASHHEVLDQAWLGDLRLVAELLWLGGDAHLAAGPLAALTREDLLLVGAQPSRELLAQVRAVTDPAALLLDGAGSQWSWQALQDRAAGSDW